MSEPLASLAELPLPGRALLRMLAFLGTGPVDVALAETPEAAILFEGALQSLSTERGELAPGVAIVQALADLRSVFPPIVSADALTPSLLLLEQARAEIPPEQRRQWVERTVHLVDAFMPAESDDPRTWSRYWASLSSRVLGIPRDT